MTRRSVNMEPIAAHPTEESLLLDPETRKIRNFEFSIYRYNPDVDDAPRMQDYTLEAEEGRDMMLLIRLSLKEKIQPVVPPLLPWRVQSVGCKR